MRYTPLLLAIIGVFIITAGCTMPGAHTGIPQTTVPPASPVNVSIHSDMTRYSVIMSSAPGMPLSACITQTTPSGTVEYRWRTDYGRFLAWNAPDFTVRELGANVSVSGGKVYWTYLDEHQNTARPPVHITLDLAYVHSGAVLGHTERIIEWENGTVAVIR
jgi:hypothetical protein